MIKLFFTDLDGTLLYLPNSKMAGFSEENRLAIQKLKDNDIRFMVATGRHHTFLPKVFNDSSLTFDTVVHCGAEIYLDQKVFYTMEFLPEEVKELIVPFEEYRLQATLRFATIGNNYIFHESNINSSQFEHFKNFVSHQGLPKDVAVTHDIGIHEYLSQAHDDPLIRLCFWFDKQEDADQYKKIIQKRFPDIYYILQISSNDLQIMKNGMNKAKGIQMIADHLEVSLDEVAVIGDSDNDIEMFNAIPLSFAMNHAAQHIRNMTKYSVDSFADAVDIVLSMNKQ